MLPIGGLILVAAFRLLFERPSTAHIYKGMVSSLLVLRTMIAILANHPEIQTRMQKEIDHVLGEAEPRLEDRDKLPYVNAVSSKYRPLSMSSPLG